ncbi:hypothetical protein [Niveispirillum cyanobacteriorum]|uniref:DUF2946 domain-containing protein n=1 Tax=Niveispirillum cyanobacteriorum TaxID=1612173 RepID=A0A2K9NG81_9PROT|nr:hypothetical protein [Niveispirillum cyanobacteriorum]AUN32022.1 hypothetical protein C0V82_16485 [Niveispirillum cyanobacteriorum]
MDMTGAMIMRQGGWRGWTAWMLLPALMLVALLPRGYMPDTAALARGALTLTLCRVVQVTLDGTGTQTVDHGLACPFGLLPVPSGPVEQAGIPLPRLWDRVPMLLLPGLIRHVPIWAHGLGARGPPGI